MTGIQRIPVAGGGPLHAAPEDQAVERASEDVRRGRGVHDDGIAVDRTPGVRTALLMTGMGAVGAGALALAASRLPRFALSASFGGPSILQWAGVGAAVVGAGLTAVGLTKGADRVGYVAKVDGSRDDALVRAAQLQHDTGVVRLDGNTWGIVDLAAEGTDIDGKGPGSVRLGAREIGFDSFVSKFGDAYVQDGSGWSNAGAPDRIDAARVGSRDLERLVGAQVGVTPTGERLVLGDAIGSVHAKRADAVRDAFERGRGDLAIVRVREGYAAFPVTGGSVSTNAEARGVRVEPMTSVELLTVDGLVGAGEPAAPFARVAMPVDDVTKVPASEAASLVGRRIGDGTLRLGEHVGTFEGIPKGGAELFEQGTGPVVFLQLDGGVAAFKVARAFDRFDTMLGGRDAVSLLDATTIRRPGTVGEATSDGRLPRVDVTSIPVADAASLTGRRIGTGNVRLGAVVETYPSVEAASAAQFEAGAPDRVILAMRGGAAVFEAKPFDGFETLLGGDRGVFSLDGNDLYAPTSTDRARSGAGAVRVVDASGLAASDARQLVGKRFAMDGDEIVRVSGIGRRFPSLEEAHRALGRSGDHVLVQLRGGVVELKLDGIPERIETGIQPFDGIRRQHGALGFETDGTSWDSIGRVVPFDVREPIGQQLSVPGAAGVAQAHVGSYASAKDAWRTAERGDGAMAVLHQPSAAGEFHVYALGWGDGGEWDEQLGDVIGLVDTRSWETSGSSTRGDTVYDTRDRHWARTRHDEDGSTKQLSHSSQEVSRTVNGPATSALRERLERERIERERREAEQRQRDAEAAERRRREEANRPQAPSGGSSSGSSGSSGGSSGGSGGGYSGGSGSGGGYSGGSGGGYSGGSGSGGNSNPGSGGGYDPGGGGAGSDW